MRRSDIPARITGATTDELARWQDLFEVLLAHPELWEGIRSERLLVKTEGRPRMAGEWGLAYLAFINSATRELTRWHRTVPPEMWEQAGFDRVPSYHAAYKNFNAFEEHQGAFRAVAAKFVQIAVEKSGGKVGHAVHVDGTEAEAHSRLVHDCRGDELASCKKQVAVPRRSTNADAREDRHALAQTAPTADDQYGAAEEMAADSEGLRVRVGGCWYRLSDDEAGVRAYVRDGKLRKFWAGYYCAKAVDHYTGGVLAVHITSASVQEHIEYPVLYEQVKEHLGRAPLAVVADRGYSIASVFEMHTRDGVASVIPWRKHWRHETRRDYKLFDRDGIPYCKGCKGETTIHRFQADTGVSGEPRLWFRCARPMGGGCEGVQSIMCNKHWRLLVPLWQTDPAYQMMLASHKSYEAAHHLWRERYAVAGDTKADRPKRRGIGVQQLRASAALVIEWVTICHRQGWLGGPVLNERQETHLTKEEARRYCRKLIRQRVARGPAVGVERQDLPAHQAEVQAAFAVGPGGRLGPASAYADLEFDKDEDENEDED